MPDTTLILIMLIAFAAGYLVGHVRGVVARRKKLDARKLRDFRYDPKQYRRP